MMEEHEPARMSQKQTESILFDVFGRMVRAERTNGRWQLFLIGTEDKKRPVPDVIVPPELTVNELAVFLDDLFHKYTSPSHPLVRRC
jgi:hypothetical protein